MTELPAAVTKLSVIAKGESFNIMYSLGLLIVDLETASRRLLYVFEVPDRTPTSVLRTEPIPDGPHSIGFLPRLKTPLEFPRADIAGSHRLSKRRETEPSQANAKGRKASEEFLLVRWRDDAVSHRLSVLGFEAAPHSDRVRR